MHSTKRQKKRAQHGFEIHDRACDIAVKISGITPTLMPMEPDSNALALRAWIRRFSNARIRQTFQVRSPLVTSWKILHYPVVLYQSFDSPHSMLKNTSESGILTIKEVSEYLKVTERTIYRLAAAKKIPAFKVGGTWRFRTADIDRWIADQTKKAEDTD